MTTRRAKAPFVVSRAHLGRVSGRGHHRLAAGNGDAGGRADGHGKEFDRGVPGGRLAEARPADRVHRAHQSPGQPKVPGFPGRLRCRPHRHHDRRLVGKRRRAAAGHDDGSAAQHAAARRADGWFLAGAARLDCIRRNSLHQPPGAGHGVGRSYHAAAERRAPAGAVGHGPEHTRHGGVAGASAG